MATVKDMAWKLYENWLKPIQPQKPILSFNELTGLIKQIEGKYDNRTVKNYIDCLLSNGWLFLESEGLPQQLINDSTSIYKYKGSTFKINPDGKFSGKPKAEILAQVFGGDLKTWSEHQHDKAVEIGKQEQQKKDTEPETAYKTGKIPKRRT